MNAEWINSVSAPLLKKAKEDTLKGTYVVLADVESIPVYLRGIVAEVIDFDLIVNEKKIQRMDLTVSCKCLKEGVEYQSSTIIKLGEIAGISTEEDYLTQPVPVKSTETEPSAQPGLNASKPEESSKPEVISNVGLFGSKLESKGFVLTSKNLNYLYNQAKILMPSETVDELVDGMIAYFKEKGIEGVTATKTVRKLRKDKVELSF